MSSYYTRPIEEGQRVTAAAFILRCATAFDYNTVRNRDSDPMDAPLLEMPVPQDYVSRLEEARSELRELQALTPEQAAAHCHEEHERAIAHQESYLRDLRESNARFEAMVPLVMAWKPTSAMETEIKGYALRQLMESIHHTVFDEPIIEPDTQEWLGQEIARLEKRIQSIQNDQKELEEHIQNRNHWVAGLYKNLPEGAVGPEPTEEQDAGQEQSMN